MHGMKVRILESTTTHEGFFRLLQIRLQYQRFDGRMSRPVVLESLERGEAVTILLYDPARDVLGLIRQFRIGPHLAGERGWVLEMVAGTCDGETDHQATARREVLEETGWKPYALEKISSFYLSPSGSTERIHLYLGLFDSSQPPDACGLEQEDEDIQPLTMPFEEAWQRMEAGEINAATPILAMQWLAMNRDRLRHAS